MSNNVKQHQTTSNDVKLSFKKTGVRFVIPGTVRINSAPTLLVRTGFSETEPAYALVVYRAQPTDAGGEAKGKVQDTNGAAPLKKQVPGPRWCQWFDVVCCARSLRSVAAARLMLRVLERRQTTSNHVKQYQTTSNYTPACIRSASMCRHGPFVRPFPLKWSQVQCASVSCLSRLMINRVWCNFPWSVTSPSTSSEVPPT